MDVTALAFAALAVAAGLLAPGDLARRALGLGGTPAERFVLAAALGRLLLAGASLAAIQLGVAGALPAGAALCALAWLALHAAARVRAGRASGEPAERSRRDVLVALAPAAAALLLVISVTGRSARLDDRGDLVFLGRDAAWDPLFYVATATRLGAAGLPLVNLYAADFPIVGHAAFYATIAGLRAVAEAGAAAAPGDPRVVLELVFRVLPLLDLAALGVAASALAGRLGATGFGAAVAGVAVLLGGHLAPLAGAALGAAGLPVRDVLAWALFGPFLLPVNPVTPALGTVFAALLALARPTRSRVVPAVVAGLLVAGSAELKVFLWAPVLAGLVLAALVHPPPAAARPLRLAAAAALLASLPSVAEKLFFARGAGARFEVGFGLCPGCLPRHLLSVAFAGGDPAFGEAFAAAGPASPAGVLAAAGASLAFLVLALGARLAALPRLARDVRDGTAPERSAVSRILAGAGAAGAALAIGAAAAPHYLNGGQFLWAASAGLAIPLGLACGAWWRAGRRLRVAAVLALAGFASARELVLQAWGAPPALRVSPDERALLRALAGSSAPDDVVLEPSWLDDADRPSLVPAFTGRRVVLTTSSAAAYLPSWERLFRLQNVERVYTAADRHEVLRAARAVGATHVLAPAHRPLRAPPGPGLEPVFENAAGAIYRVAPAPEADATSARARSGRAERPAAN